MTYADQFAVFAEWSFYGLGLGAVLSITGSLVGSALCRVLEMLK